MAGPGPGGRVKKKKVPLTARAQFNLVKKFDPSGTTRFSELIRQGKILTPAQLKQITRKASTVRSGEFKRKRRDPKSTVRSGERGAKFE